MELNFTEIAISACLFLFMWWALGIKILAPFFAMLIERESQTVGAGDAVLKKREQLNALKAKVEEELLQARLDGISFRDKLLNKAKSEASEIVSEAMSKSRLELEEARKKLNQLRLQAQIEIQKEAGDLSQVVIERVLKPGPRPTVH